MVWTRGKKRNVLIVLMCLWLISVFCCIRTVTATAAHFEQGEGTKENPYAVYSLSDLLRFSEEVNAGRTFEGEYVALYGDFSMKRFGQDFPAIDGFCGMFDGNGYTLSRLNSDALFTNLSGTIVNLSFSGEYDDSAMVSGGDGLVLNCRSTTTLVSHFDGEVFGCYSSGFLSQNTMGPLHYSVSPNMARYVSGEVIGCVRFYETMFNRSELDETLNDFRRLACWKFSLSPGDLCSWKDGKLSDKGYIFSGSGTAADPYLIRSKEDLYHFTAYVNGGEQFEGVYFRQTKSLQLNGDTFLPIGKTEGEYHFFGTYDGNGNTISDFVIDTTYGSVNNAFFGALGGTVLNLGLENGVIKGANCASFASAGVSGNALIFNCYSTITPQGDDRNGGIVDNYNGAVVNSFYRGNLPLCSYAAGEIVGCFATNRLTADEVNRNTGVVDSKVSSWNGDVKTALNAGAVFYRMEYAAGGNGIIGWKGIFSPAFALESYELKGSGSETNPYQISSADDLVYLSGAVNGGEEFENAYFAQTTNIDLSAIANFVPIGTFDGGSYFRGVYNGNGYAISGLTIQKAVRTRVDNGALFGTLGGTVMNLGIASGSISGSCVASFAVSGLPDARIVNCWSAATLHGKERSGGIVDNFAGRVTLAYYIGDAPLCSYNATTLNYCYADRVTTATFTGNATGNGDLTNLTQKLNDNLLKACMRTAFRPVGVNYWADGRPQEAGYSLRGNGSSGNPYEIATASDLLFFNAMVNSGTTYENKVVKQTADISLAGIEFIPIGLADSPYRFYGTYNGGGHCVTDLFIQSTELSVKNGFFGSLYGKVINLGLESGSISGDYVGGIASEGYYWKTLIYNCYSRVTVSGIRAGGIADDFGGDIINCWYEHEDVSVPLCSYRADTIYFCYSTGPIAGGNAIVGATSECAENLNFVSLSEVEEFHEFFNRGILTSSVKYGFVRSELVMWEIEDGALVYSDHTFTLNVDTVSRYFDLMIYLYFWNIVAIVAVLLAGVAIILSFVLEKKK